MLFLFVYVIFWHTTLPGGILYKLSYNASTLFLFSLYFVHVFLDTRFSTHHLRFYMSFIWICDPIAAIYYCIVLFCSCISRHTKILDWHFCCRFLSLLYLFMYFFTHVSPKRVHDRAWKRIFKSLLIFIPILCLLVCLSSVALLGATSTYIDYTVWNVWKWTPDIWLSWSSKIGKVWFTRIPATPWFYSHEDQPPLSPAVSWISH